MLCWSLLVCVVLPFVSDGIPEKEHIKSRFRLSFENIFFYLLHGYPTTNFESLSKGQLH